MGKMIELTATDGHQLDAYVAEPKGKPRGAIIVVQEIFGVNSHIRGVTDGYAADGYFAIAPAMFDRAERKFESGYSQDDIQRGREAMAKVPWDKTMADVPPRSAKRRRPARSASSATAGAARWSGSPRRACRGWRPRSRTTAAACPISWTSSRAAR